MKEKIRPIVELLLRAYQIDVSKFDPTFMNNSIKKRISETCSDSREAYFHLLETDSSEIKNLVDSLQVCYSEFFRNPLTYAVLENIILPNLIYKKVKSKQHEIRIWSSACAAGQEPYSLAMLLREKLNTEQINFRIFATDQSEDKIQQAKKGMYQYAEINQLNVKRLNAWFKKDKDVYIIKDEIKSHIEFSTFDCFNEHCSFPPSSIFGDFDIIICANVFFYYKPKFRGEILEKIVKSLATDGFLVTGETERDILFQNDFMEVFPESAIFKTYL